VHHSTKNILQQISEKNVMNSDVGSNFVVWAM